MATPSGVYAIPFIKALKDHYVGLLLEPSGAPVAVSIKNPQHGFKDVAYPAIGIECVTSILDWNRTTVDRVIKDVDAGTGVKKRRLEPMTFMFYIHAFTQDSQRLHSLLMQRLLEKTPFTFSLCAQMIGGDYNFGIYREELHEASIEGLDRELHDVLQLKVWGWLDTDPVGTAVKLITSDPELNMYLGLDLPEV